MPIENRLLKLILNELDKKITIRKCESCGEDNWIISDMYFPLSLEEEPTNIIMGGDKKVAPTILLICENCGYTRFYNLVSLGVIDLLEKKKKEEKNKQKEEKNKQKDGK